jgi:hypothetical protein
MSATSATSPSFRKTTHPADISRLVMNTEYYNDRLEMPLYVFTGKEVSDSAEIRLHACAASAVGAVYDRPLSVICPARSQTAPTVVLSPSFNSAATQACDRLSSRVTLICS